MSRSRMDPSLAYLEKLQLLIDYQERLLICCRSECGYALAVKHSQVTSHLRDKHIPEGDRKGLTRYLASVFSQGFRNPADLLPREARTCIPSCTSTMASRVRGAASIPSITPTFQSTFRSRLEEAIRARENGGEAKCAHEKFSILSTSL